MCVSSYANDDVEFKRPRLSDNGKGRVVKQMRTMQSYTITKKWSQREEERETEERRKSREREVKNVKEKHRTLVCQMVIKCVCHTVRVNKIKIKWRLSDNR